LLLLLREVAIRTEHRIRGFEEDGTTTTALTLLLLLLLLLLKLLLKLLLLLVELLNGLPAQLL
jgi:hypothetical protein